MYRSNAFFMNLSASVLVSYESLLPVKSVNSVVAYDGFLPKMKVVCNTSIAKVLFKQLLLYTIVTIARIKHISTFKQQYMQLGHMVPFPILDAVYVWVQQL